MTEPTTIADLVRRSDFGRLLAAKAEQERLQPRSLPRDPSVPTAQELWLRLLRQAGAGK